MSYINTYTPTKPVKPAYGPYGPDPYDINIAFPLIEETLETDRIKLTPFIPAKHAETFFAGIPDPEYFYRYLPFNMEKPEDALVFIDNSIRQNPYSVLFAIIDKTKPDDAHPDFGGTLAGGVAFLSHSPQNLVVEIGAVMILPAFQRTHVTTHVVGAMLRHSLEKPETSRPGLGLRRVNWCCHPGNAPSLKAAARMGFTYEGSMKWTWVLPEGKEGNLPGSDDISRGHGRDTTILSVTWETWQNGVRELIDKALARTF
ncbi:hypothetical protein SERLA73DRAFT_182178 [Serpula lacrymans var. lacrymans S7.3]|uniref:N-acetyltransferase domain-containing protein n=2 Tax=Serpula lacrymans var. lacrymans TaxID=341189 RepID=F8PWT6_SERL3|nr:uncharacterized protein SERLADRAFT_468703 [Serpula lacrymans var. lacrymans S7.9]EGN99263.1 hypothetical protein SERLA73DRAFT_182178 [Serpula lacrymans var. lacrymans S7.3]EGO24827.1 hypothetical protein SERLADRAFT_468703 [Serpula lacrymans var. lacrymans S7.9]